MAQSDQVQGSWPYPPGTRVLAWSELGGHGVPLVKACADHIHEIVDQAQPTNFGSGWRQIVRCLVCEETLPPLDASWFRTAANATHIQITINILQRESARLLKVCETLASPYDKPQLLNFDE